MSGNLHLLGGTGKIGTSLFNSINNFALENINKIWIYCDGNKANHYSENYSSLNSRIRFVNYSAFNLNELHKLSEKDNYEKNIIINLRGVNNKKDWLNKPLESLDTQLQSCMNLIESDLWIYPNYKIIHLSSQLCDLIEDKNSIEDICDGEDNYRKAYMISRLHQECLLTAHAYKYGVETNFIRLPFVYGFDSDKDNPWVLNSIIRSYIKNGNVNLRNPNSYAWFLHKNSLIDFLRHTILDLCINRSSNKTVSYLNCPMLGIKVIDLANLIINCIENQNENNIKKSQEILINNSINKNIDINKEVNFLVEIILNTYKYAKN